MLVSYAIAALFGGWLSYVATERLANGDLPLMFPTYYELWTFIAGGVGTILGIYLGRRYLGHPGISGLAKLALGLISINFIAALISGTLALPFFGTMFGPLALIGTLITYPILTIIWFVCLYNAHMAHGLYLQERNSIFRTLPLDQRPITP